MNINGLTQLKQQVFSEEGKLRGEIENKPLYIEKNPSEHVRKDFKSIKKAKILDHI